MFRVCAIAALLAGALTVSPAAAAPDAAQPVFVSLADSLRGTVDELVAPVRAACVAHGFEVVAVHEATAPGGCSSHAQVFVLQQPRYTQQVLAHGPRAAFAVPVRLVLFDDEAGVHLAAINPLSLDRTMVAESGFEDPAATLLADLQAVARDAGHGARAARGGFGQVRTRGLIGRTMGVMAGGPFLDKVQDVTSEPGTTQLDLARVADRVWKGVTMHAGRGRWQMRGAYRLDLAPRGVVIIGVSGPAMEAKSYAIVGAGGDARRARFACPGLAYAAAYPIEIVVYLEGGRVHVATVEAMYRMKMYFEDAGKMKFAANMTMPGSIADELRGLITAGLAQ